MGGEFVLFEQTYILEMYYVYVCSQKCVQQLPVCVLSGLPHPLPVVTSAERTVAVLYEKIVPLTWCLRGKRVVAQQENLQR